MHGDAITLANLRRLQSCPRARPADPTGLLISALEKTGVIWNVVRISPERQAAKLMSAVTPAPAPSGREVPA